MELKWHYEIEDAIAEAGERIDDHHNGGAHHKEDNFLLDLQSIISLTITRRYGSLKLEWN